jgi:hypothetical protein
MSHLDEGTLHALLDGELDLHEVKEIQAHIGSCAACGTRLREVKEFHGESDRLVGLLEMPTAPSRRTAVPADAAPGVDPLDDRAVPRPPAPRRPPPRTSGPAAEPPPLLLPEAPDYGRAKIMRRMSWAALILVAVGAGYLGTRARQSGNFDFDGLTIPAASSDSPASAVLSSEEATQAPEAGARDTAPAEAKTAAVPKRVAPRAEPPAPAGERRQPTSITSARPGALAQAGNVEEADETLSTTPSVADEAAAAEGAPEPAADRSSTDQAAVDQTQENEARPERPSDVRVEAARALQQLDRERQRDRADAATAALDSVRRREALTREAVAASPPAPRTPEQRAQIYLRIGLDEAAKQLGRPVHVIEGMSPLFMGLAFGRLSPGADATRAVVRVVYQDSQGRLILLDQQRLRPGQSTSAPGREPHWVAGDIALHLSGEVGDDVLRNWRARVR